MAAEMVMLLAAMTAGGASTESVRKQAESKDSSGLV